MSDGTYGDYRSIIGPSWLYPVTSLMEDLEPFRDDRRTTNEVSPAENGLAVATIVVAVALVESLLNRTRLAYGMHKISDDEPAALAFFKQRFRNARLLAGGLEELLLLRDIIVANLPWGARIGWDGNESRLILEPLHPGRPEGDERFHRICDEASTRTKLLRINLFPTLIGRDDAVRAIRCAYEVLLTLESDSGDSYFGVHPIRFRGQTMTLGEFVSLL